MYYCSTILGHLMRRTEASMGCIEKDTLNETLSRLERIVFEKAGFSYRDERGYIGGTTFEAHERHQTNKLAAISAPIF